MKGKDAVEDVRGQEGDGVEEDVEEAVGIGGTCAGWG